MNVSALGALFGGMGIILIGQHMEGGHVGSIIQPSAAVIVFGGTAGCVGLQFPMGDIIKAFKMLKEVVLGGHHADKKAMIAKIIEYAQIARRDSIFALEKELKTVDNVFVGAIMGLVVDGRIPKDINDAGEIEIENFEHDNHSSIKVFEAVGGYCPTVGILGAVLGLIHVMENLSDPSKLGGGIAVAFVATLYGVGMANLLALPIAGLIKHKIESDVVIKRIVLKGFIMIVEGKNPKSIENEMSFFLSEAERGTGGAAKE
jgi:chemotaxis protein MotA